jgi:hypothetical protein
LCPRLRGIGFKAVILVVYRKYLSGNQGKVICSGGGKYLGKAYL